MQGFNIAEMGHVVNVLPPKDVSGGATGDRFKMTNYAHASILVTFGVTVAGSPTILVKECTAASGGTATAIAFNYYAETTAAGDTLGAKTAATSAGISASPNNSIMYLIELDARELSDGSEWVEASITDLSTSSNLASIVAILSGSRYAETQSPTAIV
jgi:hypothetical protein